jgi:hypothetical protein
MYNGHLACRDDVLEEQGESNPSDPPKNGNTPIAGWFISWKFHLEMDDLGVPLF